MPHATGVEHVVVVPPPEPLPLLDPEPLPLLDPELELDAPASVQGVGQSNAAVHVAAPRTQA